MARFPDDSAFGGSPLASSDGPDVSDAAMTSDAATSADPLEVAKADSNYLVHTQALRDTLADEVDPDGLKDKYEALFQQAHNDSAGLIANPRQRELWAQSRAGDLDGHVLAASDRALGLARDREIGSAAAQLDAIRDSALQTTDQSRRAEFIQAASGLISGLQRAGHIEEAEAKERQKAWVEDFALAAFSKLPAAEQIKWLEGGSEKRDLGQGDLVDFVPQDKREGLLETAQLNRRNEEHAAQSATALARHQVEGRIKNGLLSILEKGNGSDDLTPDEVQAAFGPDVLRKWQDAREDYKAIRLHTEDMYALTDAQIDERLRSLAPGEDVSSHPRKTAIYHAVQERADDLRQLRLTDPAKSVADDPVVRAAAERAQASDPQAVRDLQAARLAAQERAGIDPGAQSPITRDEALALLASLRGTKVDEERDALRRVGESFAEQFGLDAERTLAFALRAMASDTQEIAATSAMLAAIARGEAAVAEEPQPAEDPIGTNDPVAEDAMAGPEPAGDADPVPDASTEDHRAPSAIMSDPLVGWDVIGPRAQERDGLEIALAALAAAKGGRKGNSIMDFLKKNPLIFPPSERDQKPPSNNPPPDPMLPPIPPPSERPAESPIPDQRLSAPDRSPTDSSPPIPQHLLDILKPEGKHVGDPGGRFGHWEWQGGQAAAERTFEALRQTARPFTPTSKHPVGRAKELYQGTMYEFPSGGTIGLRRDSKSGHPTIDIEVPGLEDIKKLKFLDR